jgi:hypothetical protein
MSLKTFIQNLAPSVFDQMPTNTVLAQFFEMHRVNLCDTNINRPIVVLIQSIRVETRFDLNNRPKNPRTDRVVSSCLGDAVVRLPRPNGYSRLTRGLRLCRAMDTKGHKKAYRRSGKQPVQSILQQAAPKTIFTPLLMSSAVNSNDWLPADLEIARLTAY